MISTPAVRQHCDTWSMSFTGVVGMLTLLFMVGPLGQTRDRRLEQPIQLESLNSTLREVTEELSEKAGVRIEPSQYLAERKVSIFVRAMTVAGTLDLICDLNGWRWYEKAPDNYLIARKSVRRPQSIADALASVSLTLPLDWQRFLGSVPETGELNPRADAYRRMGIYDERVKYPQQRRRVSTLTREYVRALRAIVESKGQQLTVEYADLKGADRNNLTACLILDSLSQFLEAPATLKVLGGKLEPYQSDIDSCHVRIRDGGIMIQKEESKDGMETVRGFGASILP